MNLSNKSPYLPPPMTTQRTRLILAAALLVVITAVVYVPAMRSGFVWDDDLHLINSVALKKNGLYHVWLTTEAFVYYPVTWSSYWLEHKLWGLNPTGYHIVNLLIHTVCALLIWRILLRLKIPGAWLAALIFAIHPVNVESAAWITQRKNLLSMFFFLITLLLYLWFDDSGNRRLYWLAVASFLLAMLSKGAVVTLPLVLLMCAWWLHKTITRQDLLRSLPFFAVSAIMSVVEVWFQYVNAIGADVVRSDSFIARLAGAGMVVWFYLYKALLPIKLCFVYPRWQIDATNWLSYLPDLALLVLFGVCWRYRRNWGRQALFGLGYFVVMVAPATGFVHFYYLRYSFVADHYQYMAIIGIIALVVAAGYHLINKLSDRRKSIATVVAVLPVVVLGVLSWNQCHIYQDERTLWLDTLQKNPKAWMAQTNFGLMLEAEGKLDEAISLYRQALQLAPDSAKSHNNLGVALQKQGKINEAIDHYRLSLQLKPNYAPAHYNLGDALDTQGKLDEAISHYYQALDIDSDYAPLHHSLGRVLQLQGKFDEAIAHYSKALEIEPDHAEAHNNLGQILAGRGELDKAIIHNRIALRLDPNSASAHINLGMALGLKDNYTEAVRHYEQALRLDPNQPVAYNNMGLATLKLGGTPKEAAEWFRKALRVKADYSTAHVNLAMVLLMQNRIDESIWHCQEVLRVNPKDSRAQQLLEAAMAKQNQSDKQKYGESRER